MTHKSFILEIGTEELPPLELKNLVTYFGQSLFNSLKQSNFKPTNPKIFASTRRLAVFFESVEHKQSDIKKTKIGPLVSMAFDIFGNPMPSALGFARSCQVNIENLERISTDKGDKLAYIEHTKSQTLSNFLQDHLEIIIKNLPIKKWMRWSNKSEAFIRPVHWILSLHGSSVLPINLFGFKSDCFTYGHRFLSPHATKLENASHYEKVLSDNYVIANYDKRQKIIKDKALALAEQLHGQLIFDKTLIEEITGLIDWPNVLYGQFDKMFLNLPSEVLIISLQSHQKCFAIKNKKGELQNKFILVSNMEPQDPIKIIQGNEKVIHARLKDAYFYYQIDQQTSFEDFAKNLKNMIFYKSLGTIFDKTKRISYLTQQWAKSFNITDLKMLDIACSLCKADLQTRMVYEFPELQGIIGFHYANNIHLPADVCHAIQEHYWPIVSGDKLPKNRLGICIALADRLDNLAGFFVLGKKPSGEKDSFALRRQMLAVLRILIEKKHMLSWDEIFTPAIKQLPLVLSDEKHLAVKQELIDFAYDRLKHWYQQQNINSKIFEAVKNCYPKSAYDFHLRIIALHHASEIDILPRLIAANKRVLNFLTKSVISTIPKEVKEIEVSQAQLSLAHEKQLFDNILKIKQDVHESVSIHNYQYRLHLLANLKDHIDAFFDGVRIMDSNNVMLKNRLAILCKLQKLFLSIADFSKL